MIKIPPAKEGDMRDTGSIPGSGRSPGGKHDNPLQYSSGESQGQRSLAGHSPWNRREPGMTDACTHTGEIRMGIAHQWCTSPRRKHRETFRIDLGDRYSGMYIYQNVLKLYLRFGHFIISLYKNLSQIVHTSSQYA